MAENHTLVDIPPKRDWFNDINWQLANKMAASARAANVNNATNHPPYLFPLVHMCDSYNWFFYGHEIEWSLTAVVSIIPFKSYFRY